jgi:hypothetical protein
MLLFYIQETMEHLIGRDSYQRTRNVFQKGRHMVVFVKISKKGKLVRIKEVPDTYRDTPYQWDEDE